ncbi:hypothetical protein TNIN_224351 [Trichonephila inaurata madagascariensis]|uniref:Uncharacterized protein n=1 Tax=Trichonephila inaurata madagascariensis TaxID=2747483 RepID=A0A8X6Y787_9ARAC|nr:hypothetical protein TNIN_429451 [Trichonephila inaurata madagascariensis]GFY65610.1 hypothetical protein TNIN_224351 [Trichonephila inaurata madagascariensis]
MFVEDLVYLITLSPSQISEALQGFNGSAWVIRPSLPPERMIQAKPSSQLKKCSLFIRFQHAGLGTLSVNNFAYLKVYFEGVFHIGRRRVICYVVIYR